MQPKRFHFDTIHALQIEAYNARAKHPGNMHLLAALAEELGELAKAHLENETPERIRAEAVQVAVVALRIFEEGAGEFDPTPSA